jgi:hypothetical protein
MIRTPQKKQKDTQVLYLMRAPLDYFVLLTDEYNVTVVSPRNYFLFTPLLPGTTTGTVEYRSIIEVRGVNFDLLAQRLALAKCI